MKEIAEVLSNYGGLVVLALLFVWAYIQDRNDRREEKSTNTQVLKELSTSNNNIAESLNLLKTSIDNNTAEFRQHDERAIQAFNEINEKLIKIDAKIR